MSKSIKRAFVLAALFGAAWGGPAFADGNFLNIVQDGKLLTKGQLIAGLRHDNELLVAEMIDNGILEDTTLAEAATLCSCLIEESRSGDGFVPRHPAGF